MPLVSRERVGTVAFDRLIRDGTCTPLSPAFALPRDIPETPGLRAIAVGGFIPQHTLLSSLGGLWVLLGGMPPAVFDVVGPRGLHRVAGPVQPATPLSAPRIAFHSGRAPTERFTTVSGVKVANVSRCCVDALRWGDHRVAIPAVARAVRLSGVGLDALHIAFAADHPRGSGYARLNSVWSALAPALGYLSEEADASGTTGRDALSP
jgi:hypothetical protein